MCNILTPDGLLFKILTISFSYLSDNSCALRALSKYKDDIYVGCTIIIGCCCVSRCVSCVCVCGVVGRAGN